MREKLISIFLTCLFAFSLLIVPVNAQKTMSVKEFDTNYPYKQGSCVSEHVIVSGFIHEIRPGRPDRPGYGFYSFNIDDGARNRNFFYYGGLGDIKEGDKVFVEINPSESFFDVPLNYEFKAGDCGYYGIGGGAVFVLTVSKSLAKSDATTPAKHEAASAPKTPGFEIVIGAVAMFFAWKKLLQRK